MLGSCSPVIALNLKIDLFFLQQTEKKVIFKIFRSYDICSRRIVHVLHVPFGLSFVHRRSEVFWSQAYALFFLHRTFLCNSFPRCNCPLPFGAQKYTRLKIKILFWCRNEKLKHTIWLSSVSTWICSLCKCFFKFFNCCSTSLLDVFDLTEAFCNGIFFTICLLKNR